MLVSTSQTEKESKNLTNSPKESSLIESQNRIQEFNPDPREAKNPINLKCKTAKSS